MQPSNMAYDRAITVFSPDGRQFQVEYAREAVKRGTTTVGLKYDNGVLLMIEKRITSRLIEAASIEKIFRIDDLVGCATSGLVADARVLVERAQLEGQIHRITYGEKTTVDSLVKKICDFKQNYTQFGGVRPFGTALLIAGFDEQGLHLYETDPSGAVIAYKAASIGAGRDTVVRVFEEKYKDNMSKKDAIELGLEALMESSEKSVETDRIEIGLITKDQKFSLLSPEEVAKYAKPFMKKNSKE